MPRPLKHELTGHDVSAAVEQGWSGKRNNELLWVMLAAGFEGFLTLDQNLQFQQNVAASGIAVSRGDSARIMVFLDLIASAWTPASAQGAYDPRRAGQWDAQRFGSLLARGGVTFHNVNGDSTWYLTAQALRRELSGRRGAAFDMLLHLGYIYTQPYPPYSRLSFTQDPSGVQYGSADSVMTLSLNLPGDTERRLAEIAKRLNVPVHDLAAAAVRDLLAQPTEDFEAVARRVLDKNRELYSRLA